MDPVKDSRETKLPLSDRPSNEDVCLVWIHNEGKPIDQQEGVSRIECNPLVAIDERVVARQRLHQRRRLFRQVVVVAILGTENGGFQGTLIPQSMDAAVVFDLPMMNREYFCHRQVDALRHLLIAG